MEIFFDVWPRSTDVTGCRLTFSPCINCRPRARNSLRRKLARNRTSLRSSNLLIIPTEIRSCYLVVPDTIDVVDESPKNRFRYLTNFMGRSLKSVGASSRTSRICTDASALPFRLPSTTTPPRSKKLVSRSSPFDYSPPSRLICKARHLILQNRIDCSILYNIRE